MDREEFIKNLEKNGYNEKEIKHRVKQIEDKWWEMMKKEIENNQKIQESQ